MFQNCIGAIDGTHVNARTSHDNQIPFCGRKVDTTWNVMWACSFDMQFTYVMSGWEGIANDARVFTESISDAANQFPTPTGGIYCIYNNLVDLISFLLFFHSTNKCVYYVVVLDIQTCPDFYLLTMIRDTAYMILEGSTTTM